MTRTIFPMEVADLSAFAKTLREQIGRLDHQPSHVEMLNLLCKAAGYRNYQHFRTRKPQDADAGVEQSLAAITEAPPNEARVLKMLRLFDGEGRIVRWPGKRAQQELCLWLLWSKIPRGRSYSEREISEFLNTLHLFGDAARLRRDMFDHGMVRRNRDGSDYRRIEQKPPEELRLLLSRIGPRKAEAA
jgi:hypothetical protein